MKLSRKGFTLIEVMIAVVILAVGMSSLFTSEAGAVRIAQRARTTTIATLLARCKMGEIEERVAKEGWPGEQIDGRDECCEGAEHDGFKCEWKVERVVLPDMDQQGDGGVSDGEKDEKKEKSTAGSPGGGLAGGASDGGITGDGGILDGLLTELGSTGTGGDPLAAMAMELTFPVIKPVIEEGVRRATVNVSWKEGNSEQSFDVVQYLVNELPIIPSESQVQAIQDMGGTGGTGGGAGGRSTTPTPSTPSSGRRGN